MFFCFLPIIHAMGGSTKGCAGNEYFSTTTGTIWYTSSQAYRELLLIKHSAMKLGGWRYSSTILDLGTRWR
jgi:hypothetical protein